MSRAVSGSKCRKELEDFFFKFKSDVMNWGVAFPGSIRTYQFMARENWCDSSQNVVHF